MPDPELLRQGGLGLAARLFAPRDLRASGAQLRWLRSFAADGDPLADAVASQVREHGAAPFDLALTHGIAAVADASPELAAFFRSVEHTPYWVDRRRLARGARAITRTGLLSLFPLGDISLMGGYLASRATKSLVGTGAIENAATRRLLETATWWIDVTTPGALEPGAPGYAAALRIRLVHAHVRAAMHARPDWDYDAWDHPVNQVQTVGTLLLFSQVYVLGMRLLGVRYTAGERADILHLWRYVGWLMGVDDALLPATEDDAWRLLWLLASTEFIPDGDSRRLASALLDTHAGVGDGRGALGKVLAHVSVRAHASVSRLALGRRNGDLLGLPDDPLAQGAVLGAAAANFAVETVRRHVPGATALQELLGAAGRRHYARRANEAVGASRAPARHMNPAA